MVLSGVSCDIESTRALPSSRLDLLSKPLLGTRRGHRIATLVLQTYLPTSNSRAVCSNLDIIYSANNM